MKHSKEYKYYLAGLKGFACLLIMIGHFIGIYRAAQVFTPGIPLLDMLLSSPLSFLIDEGYWLYLFFVISGFLVAQSDVVSVADVVKKGINRFFRFAFPVMFAYLVIYFIYLTVGFQNAQTVAIFQCNWFQKYFQEGYSILDVISSPVHVLLRGEVVLNRPYWVLQMMFFSSLLIYFLKYVYCRMAEKFEGVCFTALVIVTLASITISPVMTACLTGMLLAVYEKQIGSLAQKPVFAFWVMVIAMLVYVLPKTLLSAIFFGTVIILLPKIKVLDQIFSSKLFQFFGNISWGIYSFHWPVISSVGAMLMLAFYQRIGNISAYLLACFASMVITLFLSVVFYYTFERLSGWLTKQINIGVIKLFARDKKRL